MPKSKSGSASRSQPLALELLDADHRKVERLFARYEREKEGEDDTKREISERICGELKVHAQVEEEVFYPWLRENLDDMELVEEAEVEHQGAKDLIAKIEASQEIDDAYDAKVKVLGEYIKHHVKEEENEIFPAIRDEREALDELGQEIAARKAELMEEMGLEADEAEEEDEESRPASGRGKTQRESAQRGPR